MWVIDLETTIILLSTGHKFYKNIS